MFANIVNGQLTKKPYILQTRQKTCESFLNILWDEGFISGYKICDFDSKKLKIFLKYTKNDPVITKLKSISKPSRRVYYTLKQIWKIDSNKTFVILSTNQGLKSIVDCKKQRIGGEPLVIIN